MDLYREDIIDNKSYGVKEHKFAGIGFTDLFERSLRNESLSVNLGKYVYDKTDDEPIDESFVDANKDKIWEENKHRINSGFKDYIFKRSVNEERMYELLDEYEQESKTQEYLDSLGFSGVMMNIGSNMVDIPLYLAGIATAEISAPVLATSMTSTFARRALVGGAVEGFFEFAKDNIGEKDRTALDYTLGIAFGAGINGIFRGDNLLEDTSKRAMDRILKSDELKDELAKATTKEEKERVYKEHAKKLNLSQDGKRTVTQALKDMKDDVKKGRLGEDVYNTFRKDLAYMTQTSDSDTFSSIAKNIFFDETLQSNTANKISNMELATNIEQSIIDTSISNLNDTLYAFAKSKGSNFLKARFDITRDLFSNIAGMVQARRNLFNISDEDAVNYAKELFLKNGAKEQDLDSLSDGLVKALSKDARDSHRILKTNGKNGFDTIKEDDKYFTIMYDKNMKNNLENKGINYGMFKSFIKESIQSNLSKKSIDIDEDLLDLITEGVSNGVWHNKDNLVGSPDSFEDVMTGVLNSLIAKDNRFSKIKDALYSKSDELNDAGKVSSVYSKARSPLDYSYIKTFTKSDGKQIDLSFEDLINKNYNGVKTVYARKMGGTTALEKTTVNVKKIDLDKYNTLVNSKRTLRDRTFSRLKEIKKSIEDGTINYREVMKDLGIRIDETLTDEDILSMFNELKIEDVAKQLESVKIDKSYNEAKKLFGEDVANRLKENAEIIGGRYKALVRELRSNNATNEDIEKAVKELSQRLEDEARNANIYNDYKKLSEYESELNLGNTKDVEEIRAKINDELIEKGLSDKQRNAEITRFDEIVNELRGNPTSTDPFGTATQIQRIIKNINIARLLGQTGITMTAELGSAINHVGIKKMFEFSSMKKLVDQMRTGKIDDELTQEIQSHFGLGNELNRAIGSNRYEHQFNTADMNFSNKMSSILDRMEGISEKFSEATLLVGGIKPLTAWMEDIIAKDTIHNITMAFGSKGGLTKSELKSLNELGIDETMVNKIRVQFNKYSDVSDSDFFAGKKVRKLNFDKWDDDEAKRFLVNATRRITTTVIQKSTMGSKLGVVQGSKLFRNTLMGKFVLELKDYMVSSYVKQLGRAIGRRDAYVMGMLFAQIGALTLGTVTQNYMNFAGNEDKLKESMKPENLISNIAQKLPISSYIPTAIDTASRVLTGEPIIQHNRYHSGVQSAVLGLPALDLLIKLEKTLLRTPVNIATGKFGQSDVSSMFGIMLLGNTYGIRTLKEAWQDNLK